MKQYKIITDENIYIPQEISNDELLKVHTKAYLDSLRVSVLNWILLNTFFKHEVVDYFDIILQWSCKVAAVAEIPLLALLPNVALQKMYLKCMR